MRRQSGFTLVELMIVILIVAILAAIAIPAYQQQIRKGRRTDAKTALLDLAGREERYYAASNQYTQDPTALGYPAGALSGSTPIGNGYYTVLAAQGASKDSGSYQFTANPVAGTSQALDSQCQVFTIDNTGKQGSTDGATDTTATCW
jgi:type IV pilus assembly protein PilE